MSLDNNETAGALAIPTVVAPVYLATEQLQCLHSKLVQTKEPVYHGCFINCLILISLRTNPNSY